MEFKLTQKERIFLEDAKAIEQVCKQKYENYAHQVTDSELKQLLYKHSQQEQQHHDSISLLLQGKKPALGEGNQSNSGEEEQTDSNQTQQYEQSSIKNNLEGTMQNESDKVICLDLLTTERYVSGNYDSDIFECTNSEVREVLQHIQKEEQTHGEELFNYMNSHGMCNLE